MKQALVVLFVSTWLVPVSGAAQTPTTVLIDGSVISLDSDSSVYEAVAIYEDRILALGSTNAMLPLAGEDTQVVSLGGRTVIPGLIDSHIHAIRAGRSFATEVSWIGTSSITEAMERIRIKARSTAPDSWIIVAGGWDPQQFQERRTPTQAELMEAAGPHPAYVQLGYSWILMNPRGLELLGLGPDTVPDDGRLENGVLSGPTPVIVNTFDKLPRPTFEQQVEGTKQFFRELNRLAITGVSDPGGSNMAPGPDYHALFEVWQNKDLTVRVVYSVGGMPPGRELSEFQNVTRMLPMGFGDPMLRFNGIGEQVTAAMNNNDTPSESDRERLYDVLRWAAERRFTVTFHWPNDRSVHYLLDIFEQVHRDLGIDDLRWSIAHLNDASGLSLERMRDLGVGWTVQLGMYYGGERYREQAGEAAAARTPDVVLAQRLNTPTGMGTDAHRVATYNPFTALEWLLDGRTISGAQVRRDNGIPTRDAALRLYTIGSAWFSHDDEERGSLEVGKLADLAVLSADYSTIPVEQIGDLESLLTMVGGRIVYAAGDFAGLER